MPELPEVETTRRGIASVLNRPLSASSALGCLVVAWLGGRLFEEWNWMADSAGAAHLYPLGCEYGYAAVIGWWAALAPHAAWKRALLACLIGGLFLLTLNHDHRVAFAVLAVTSGAVAIAVSRWLGLKLACGAKVASNHPVRFSMRQVFYLLTVMSIVCGWGAFVYAGQTQMSREDVAGYVFSVVLTASLLIPLLGACFFVSVRERTWLYAACMLLSPLATGLLATTIIAISPYAKDYWVSTDPLAAFWYSTAELTLVAAGAQWTALAASAVLSWAGYRIVRGAAHA